MKPKFKIDDKVFILYNNRIEQITVFTILISKIKDNQISISYRNPYSTGYLSESQLFKTKEELLNSL